MLVAFVKSLESDRKFYCTIYVKQGCKTHAICVKQGCKMRINEEVYVFLDFFKGVYGIKSALIYNEIRMILNCWLI